jgi:hypothetical protein
MLGIIYKISFYDRRRQLEFILCKSVRAKKISAPKLQKLFRSPVFVTPLAAAAS